MIRLFRYFSGFIIIAISLSFQCYGQVCQTYDPTMLTVSKNTSRSVEYFTLDSAKDIIRDNPEKGPIVAGYTVPFKNKDFDNGRWMSVDHDLLIWKLGIIVPGARAINIYFDDVDLKYGDKLFIYDPKMEHVLGALTQLNDADHLGTIFLQNDSLIVEYRTSENKKIIPFSISEIGISVDPFANDSRDFGDSGDCEVLINCPEGTNYQDEKRGVVRVLVKQGASLFWCSGSLINNTNRDGTPYFLTAHHCGENSTAEDYSKWLFYFNFESKDCEVPLLEPEEQSISGAKLIADGEKTSIGSDFKLLLLQEDIPKSYHPYFNGWDRSTDPSDKGVGIHHPEGDLKMVSTYNNPLVSTNYNNTEPDQNGRFWQVQWSETPSGHGVTEGGSSGSPIFNSEGYIVGTLSGGRASCTHLDQPDYYGKFSAHWESNGNDSSSQLKPWLDPIGSDLPALRGLELDSSELKADFDSYNTHIRVGDGVQFNNKSIGDITEFIWEFKGGEPEFSESETPPLIYYHKIGEYDVKLTVKSPIHTDSLLIRKYVRVLPNIYPNPSKNGIFYLVFGQNVPDDLEIHVYNAMGQIVQFNANASDKNTVVLKLDEQPLGIYLIKIKSNGNIQTLKVGNKIISSL